MNEREFRQLLELFPVVRSRNYCAESESSTSRIAQRDDEKIEWKDASSAGVSYEDSTTDLINEDSFWEKLRLSAEKKTRKHLDYSTRFHIGQHQFDVLVGRVQAEKFCEAFKKAHKKLVYEELSLDAAQKFIQESQIS